MDEVEKPPLGAPSGPASPGGAIIDIAANTPTPGGSTILANAVAVAPPLIVGGAASYVAVRGIAAGVNAIMNVLNLGGSNLAGTTEVATQLDPSKLDPELMQELLLAADEGTLLNPGTGEPITREAIENGEAYYPDYLLREIAEGGHGLDFDEATEGAHKVGEDGSAGLNVGGTKIQAQQNAKFADAGFTARTVQKLGMNANGLDAFSKIFKAELQNTQTRREFNRDPQKFLASRKYKIIDGMLHGPGVAAAPA